MTQEGPILFCRVSDPFGFLSNFAPAPIELDGRLWPTSEHYFQAMKFDRAEYQEKIRTSPSPMIAAHLGRSRKEPIRRDWETLKLQVMETALRAKFTQHEELQRQLIGTGCRELIEHTPRDPFWGDGGDGSGANHLGKLLMHIREDLRRGVKPQGGRT